MKRRVVVIVGRPNVGKSALFNRIAGRRISIVHEQSGVTRDLIKREATWGGETFEIIDTGGICNIDRARETDSIESAVHKQVETALEDAAVAIFVVSVHSGVVPLDEEVARLLRSRHCKTFIAANKADNEKRDADAADFERFGFPVFPVSALHNRGLDPLMKDVLTALPDIRNETIESPLKVAVVGRPNAGKSMYINKLLKADRVIVSSIPGTTRDSVDVPFTIGDGKDARHYVFIDTAGMRQRTNTDNPVDWYSQLRTKESVGAADIVILMMDAVEGPTEQDKKIASMALVAGKGCVVLVNKWDLADGKVSQRKYEQAIREVMPFMTHCPVVFLSAKSGYNVRYAVDVIDQVASQVRSVIPTGILNRSLIDAYDRVRPPSVKGRIAKIYYATQTGHSPIRILVFVNDPVLFKESYRGYLIGKLRERFGLEGTPVRLEFKSRKRSRN